MIPAHGYGYEAVYSDGENEVRLPVAAWDDDGWAMVPGHKGRLMRADGRQVRYATFDRVEPAPREGVQ